MGFGLVMGRNQNQTSSHGRLTGIVPKLDACFVSDLILFMTVAVKFLAATR